MAKMYGVARLGKDAEVRYLPNGDPVVMLALGFSYGKRDPAKNNFKPTQWVEGVHFGEHAVKLSGHLLKGRKIEITLDDVHIESYPINGGGEGFKLCGKVIGGIEFVTSEQQQTQSGQQQQSQPEASQPAPRPNQRQR